MNAPHRHGWKTVAAILVLAALVVTGLSAALPPQSASAFQDASECVAPNFVQQGPSCFVTLLGVAAGCTVANGTPACTNGRLVAPCPDDFVELATGNCWPKADTCDYNRAITSQCCSYSSVIVNNCEKSIAPVFCDYAGAIGRQCCTYSNAITDLCFFQRFEVVNIPDDVTPLTTSVTPTATPTPAVTPVPTPVFTIESGPLTIGTESSVPLVWQPTTLVLTGCSDGFASFVVFDSAAASAAAGTFVEGPAGTYVATFSGLPGSGQYEIQTAITCPGGSVERQTAQITYYDPSGQVRDCAGTPIVGATVTLTRSDTEAGDFTTVPNGSAIMSPKNRLNPMPADLNGLYGWDVADGFYIVVVDAGGYGAQQTEPLEVPPPRFNVNFDFPCIEGPQQPSATTLRGTIIASAPADTDPSPGPNSPEAPVATSIEATPGPKLAVTGTNADALQMIGITLFAMGLSAVGAARRRRQLSR